jgi:UDP-N-acetylglucosamine acyltransferase
MNIHPTAIIEPGADLAEGVSIGPYAYVGKGVKLGKHTCLHHHACVEGKTTLGEFNEIYPFACIGGKTHDLKYTGGDARLVIGDYNVFREYVTIHTATQESDVTFLGSHNVILAYGHVAHDCKIGNHMIMSSQAALGGHVIVGDYVNVGWGAGVHQFCHLGDYAMVGACSKLVQDVLPFMIADGNPALTRTVNKVILERQGFSDERIQRIRRAFKLLYKLGFNRTQALDLMNTDDFQHADIDKIRDFLANSRRGLA